MHAIYVNILILHAIFSQPSGSLLASAADCIIRIWNLEGIIAVTKKIVSLEFVCRSENTIHVKVYVLHKWKGSREPMASEAACVKQKLSLIKNFRKNESTIFFNDQSPLYQRV